MSNTTARGTPAGTKLNNGMSTKIAPLADPDISFWEKTLQPIGLDGGDEIETTTMHNATYETFSPRSLMRATPCNITAAYDPLVYDQIIAIMNSNNEWTVHFPNGDTVDFWGWLRQFLPDTHSRGDQPEASIEITPSNEDSTGAEVAPNYKTSVGTD